MKTCKICGKELPTNKKSFCSNDCKYKDATLNQNKKVKLKCLICGKEFEIGFNRIDKAKTCSNICRGILRQNESREIRKCKLCNKEFEVYKKVKKEFCSDICRKEWSLIPENKIQRIKNSKESNIKNHNGLHNSQTNEFVIKLKQTKLKNHGDENYVNVQMAKTTKKEKYGDENYNNIKKNKETKLKNHGDENYNNREKFNETMQKLYGVDWAMQSEELFNKAKQTLKSKSGVEYSYQNPKNRNKIIDLYGGLGMSSKILRKKIEETNLKKYGYKVPMQNKEIYNKAIKTLKEKYGVNNAYLIHPSNGNRVSKVQKKLYEYILTIYPDALLEYYLTDIDLSVDIYIPSIKTVIEMYGDYWHCNPELFDETYEHKLIHMTAKEIWDKDLCRENKITNSGYKLIIIWENIVKTIIKNNIQPTGATFPE